uniref:Uncharacterized protein n=1 Tax=Anguilla anguilla TaxID=7936 RepID=A0A0E9XP00_ANGAN
MWLLNSTNTVAFSDVLKDLVVVTLFPSEVFLWRRSWLKDSLTRGRSHTLNHVVSFTVLFQRKEKLKGLCG